MATLSRRPILEELEELTGSDSRSLTNAVAALFGIPVAVPFASLDQVDFKREAVNSVNLEAKLRFTLYLNHLNGNVGSAGREEIVE